jgi:hypothetical protein
MQLVHLSAILPAVLTAPVGVQRDISRSTGQTASTIHGNAAPASTSRLPAEVREHVVDVSRLALHGKVALISTWNQSIDAVFNPLIRELHRRGW